MSERVIFLDFDGVILTYRTLLASEHRGHSQANPDPLLCSLIRMACMKGIAIVVSSSWRDSERFCREKLADGRILRFLHADWRTGEINTSNSRSLEVEAWLKSHPEVSDYRILDDDDFQWTPEQRARWYECSPYDGMSAMDMKDLSEWGGN